MSEGNGPEIHTQPVPYPTPEPDVVRQYDQPQQRNVPVTVKGPVYAASLPARHSVELTITVDTLLNLNDPQEVIPADPRLKRVWLSCDAADGKVFIGTREQVTSPQGPQGFALPSFKPMEWSGFTKARFAVATTAGPFHISCHYEYWAD